jgi:hypothetical protein
MYHGNYESTAVLHPGLCLTDDDDLARDYGRGSRGRLHALDVDLAGLTVADLADGYDHDENTAPGDDGQGFGADVIVFWDETDAGRRHRTWRLMTPAALAAVTVAGSEQD